MIIVTLTEPSTLLHTINTLLFTIITKRSEHYYFHFTVKEPDSKKSSILPKDMKLVNG